MNISTPETLKLHTELTANPDYTLRESILLSKTIDGRKLK